VSVGQQLRCLCSILLRMPEVIRPYGS
jgi:hypothetical protein